MKKLIIILFSSLLLMACQKESTPESLTPQLFLNEVQQIESNKYLLSGSYNPIGKELVNSAIFHYGTTEAMEQSITAELSGRTATTILEGLKAGTTYYYCLEIGNGLDSTCSEMRSFRTEAITTSAILKNANLINAVETQLNRTFQKEANGTVLLDNDYNQRLVEMVKELEITDMEDPLLCDEIGYFTSLETLVCSRNDIVTLDLSNNLALKELWCEGKDIIETNDVGDEEWRGKSGKLNDLVLPQTTTLKEVWISGHMLTSIDVSACPNLEKFDCSFGSLVELDLSHNSQLNELKCERNLLTCLDLSNNIDLTSIHCQNNHLVDLDLTNLVNLVIIDCGGNPITSIDLSKNTLLESLSIYNSKITSIDLSHQPYLKELDFNVHELQSLDLSHLPLLERLLCQYGPLTELDLSHNPKLNYLEAHGNHLTSIDLTNNHDLTWLTCFRNHLTELDISMIDDNVSILVGNQITQSEEPLTLTLFVNAVQYAHKPGTYIYYMDKYNTGNQDRVNVVLRK